VLALPSPQAIAGPFGRLFTTPQQRQELDELRDAEAEEPTIPVAVQASAAEIPNAPRDPLTVRGIVTRTNGPDAAWINDSNTFEGDLTAEYLRLKPEDIDPDSVQLPATGEHRLFGPDEKITVPVKVGQTLEPSTGTVIDLTQQHLAHPPSPLQGEGRGGGEAVAPPD
jgi:phosphoribosyl 1,2-cyclic phosphodiesterase